MAIPFVDLLVERVPEIPHVLNSGIDATIHWLADAAEDTLGTYVPAYVVAKAQAILICQAGGKSEDECKSFIDRVKYAAMDELATITGLRQIVAAIIAAWRAIPRAIRELVAAGGDALKEVKKVLGGVGNFAAGLISFDPSKTLEALKDAPSLLYSAGVNVFNNALGTTASVLTMWQKKGQDLADKIEVPGLREIASGLITLTTMPVYLAGKAVEAAKWIFDKLADAGVKWVVNRLGDAVSSALGSTRAPDLDLIITKSKWVTTCTAQDGSSCETFLVSGYDRKTGKTMTDFITSEVGHTQSDWYEDDNFEWWYIWSTFCHGPIGTVHQA